MFLLSYKSDENLKSRNKIFCYSQIHATSFGGREFLNENIQNAIRDYPRLIIDSKICAVFIRRDEGKMRFCSMTFPIFSWWFWLRSHKSFSLFIHHHIFFLHLSPHLDIDRSKKMSVASALYLKVPVLECSIRTRVCSSEDKNEVRG